MLAKQILIMIPAGPKILAAIAYITLVFIFGLLSDSKFSVKSKSQVFLSLSV